MSIDQVTPLAKFRRLSAAVVLSAGLLFTAACSGHPPQTSQPYTPADGVNLDVASPDNPRFVLRVRNLTIVSSTAGQGVLSGSMTSDSPDSLVAVSGRALKVDGSEGAELTGTLTGPVPVGGSLTVLSTSPITLSSPDLAAGLTAEVTLKFEKAGEQQLRLPVVDGAAPQYSGLKPSASASESATTTSMSPTPASSSAAAASPSPTA